MALDFTSLLRQGEGALVGSSAKLLALVHGETIEGELVPARPFRVNAGPVPASRTRPVAILLLTLAGLSYPSCSWVNGNAISGTLPPEYASWRLITIL